MNLAKKLMDEVAKSRRTIVVIGDRMVDRWHLGRLEHCQDECQKFVVEDTVETPGGAANARRSLENWDVSVTLHSYTTDIPIKNRYVVDDRIMFRVDRERSVEEPTLDYQLLGSQAGAVSAALYADAVLLSDYDKGFLTPQFIREVSRLCNSRGIPCVADCKRAPEVYEGCILKGNEFYHHKYERQLPIEGKVVITHGERVPFAATRFGREGRPADLGLPEVNCVNHVGAGDCFAAHLALALAYGFSLRDAAALAHSAGRVYVQHPFNRPPFPCEVADDLDSIAQ